MTVLIMTEWHHDDTGGNEHSEDSYDVSTILCICGYLIHYDDVSDA